MKRYLQANHAAANLVEQACDCIRAIASQPLLSHLSEKIICDAVTYDYGTPFFRETSSYKPPETLAMLNNHVYYTEYCQLRLSRGKLENIQWLKTLM